MPGKPVTKQNLPKVGQMVSYKGEEGMVMKVSAKSGRIIIVDFEHDKEQFARVGHDGKYRLQGSPLNSETLMVESTMPKTQMLKFTGPDAKEKASKEQKKWKDQGHKAKIEHDVFGKRWLVHVTWVKGATKMKEEKTTMTKAEFQASGPPDLKKWWTYTPEKVMRAVYWKKGQIPPTGAKFESNWKRVKAQLQKMHPSPNNEVQIREVVRHVVKEYFEGDESVASELRMWIDNDAQLYRQQYQPILKNLGKKRDKGVFDQKLAAKLFMYLVVNGAKSYAKQFGGPGQKWNDMFSMKVRKLVADEFATDYAAGNLE